MTAGIAAASPAALVMSASEIPGATARSVAAPAVPNPWKASIMPHTVPNNPTNGATFAIVASHCSRRSNRVCSSEPAICIARCTEVVFLIPVVGLPPCRRYSSYPPSKIDTSGLGRNCSETAATSCRRTAFLNARKKRPLCTRARLYELHLDRITAHEIRLKRRRMRRTTLATIPLCATRFAISPPMIAVRKFKMIIVSVSNCTLEFWIRQAFYNYVVDCDSPGRHPERGWAPAVFSGLGEPERWILVWTSFRVSRLVEEAIQSQKLTTNN